MTSVKICGITNLDDAQVAADAGADLLGFVFYARSPRYVSPERAGEIVAALRARGPAPRWVGVFVNETAERVRAAMRSAGLDLAQLHGDESLETVRALAPFAFKALRLRAGEAALAVAAPFRTVAADGSDSPAFLVDAFDPRQYGGTGSRADWSGAARLAESYPILLAGGLNAANVADAVCRVKPWGVDVSSGVERAPGIKDHARVREFIAQVRHAALEPGRGDGKGDLE